MCMGMAGRRHGPDLRRRAERSGRCHRRASSSLRLSCAAAAAVPAGSCGYSTASAPVVPFGSAAACVVDAGPLARVGLAARAAERRLGYSRRRTGRQHRHVPSRAPDALLGDRHGRLQFAVVEDAPFERRSGRSGSGGAGSVTSSCSGPRRRPPAAPSRQRPAGCGDPIADAPDPRVRTAAARGRRDLDDDARFLELLEQGAAFLTAMPSPAASEVAETSGAVRRSIAAAARGSRCCPATAPRAASQPRSTSNNSCSATVSAASAARNARTSFTRRPGRLRAQRGGAGQRHRQPQQAASHPVPHQGAAHRPPARSIQACKASAPASSGVPPRARRARLPPARPRLPGRSPARSTSSRWMAR